MMEAAQELLLRCISIFLTVYFVIGWGKNNNIQNDIPFLIIAIAAAIATRYFEN